MHKTKLHFPEGPWKSLLEKAFRLIDTVAIDCGASIPRWSLGGGTVLMFHYANRKSKDIDIFVPDPHFLGFVNPRISDHAENVTSDYQDGAGYVKYSYPRVK